MSETLAAPAKTFGEQLDQRRAERRTEDLKRYYQLLIAFDSLPTEAADELIELQHRLKLTDENFDRDKRLVAEFRELVPAAKNYEALHAEATAAIGGWHRIKTEHRETIRRLEKEIIDAQVRYQVLRAKADDCAKAGRRVAEIRVSNPTLIEVIEKAALFAAMEDDGNPVEPP